LRGIADHEIWKLSLGDGAITKLMKGNQPDRTPDGNFVYTFSDLDESSDGITVKTIVKLVNYPVGYNNAFAWPRVSPDGTKTAYQDLSVDGFVATINLDGSGLKLVTTGNGEESFPAWSPDGTKLAAWNQYTLLTFNADGTGTAYDVLASHPETSYNFLTDIPFCWR
jgi:WD40 repeat protein